MPSFDELADHLAAQAAGGAAGAPRASGRILSSECFDRYTPFSMHSLAADRAQPQPAAAPAREPDAGDFEAGRKAGLADGFRQGFDAGVTHAQAGYREREVQAGKRLAERVHALDQALRERFEEIEREAADAVVALALDVARQALRSTLAVRPESIVPVVQEALASLFGESVRVHLYLNPGDAMLVREELGARLANMNCDIVADPSISAGGCRIETPRAGVDATLETRWRRTLAAIGHADAGGHADVAGHHDAAGHADAAGHRDAAGRREAIAEPAP